MMSNANREIRLIEQREAERRRLSAPARAIQYLDQLIEELEEMNLSNIDELPVGFVARFNQLSRFLPLLTARQPRPTRVRVALDRCFELQAQILSRASSNEPWAESASR